MFESLFSGYGLELLKIVIAPSVTVAALSYVIKVIIDHNGKREIEKFKKELERSLFEFQTKFSFYHNKQVEVISVIYSSLVDFNKQMVNLTSIIQLLPQENLQTKKAVTWDAFISFKEYYEKNLIFLDEDICKKIESILSQSQLAFHTFAGFQVSESYLSDETGSWKKAFEIVCNQIQPLTEELKIVFRKVVGSTKTI
ncbi:MAG: hypothetical protein M0Q21_09805 [Ignavibacteriaceae bacterium]|nr:hypothetical protein [Ignavibacteriaceae bacterium]